MKTEIIAEPICEYPPDSWFCLHALAKHEHIAAASLSQIPDVEVFLPRLRFRRATRRGAVWVTEPLFPNYLFARFDLHLRFRRVRSLAGIRNLVRFGERWATVPDAVIQDLRCFTGPNDTCLIPEEIISGDCVQITGGLFHGLRAVVTQVLPSRERVKVLLEFLGRTTEMEVGRADIVRTVQNPLAV